MDLHLNRKKTQLGLEINTDDQKMAFSSSISSVKRKCWARLSPGPNLLTDAGRVSVIDAHQASVALEPGEAEGQVSGCLSSISQGSTYRPGLSWVAGSGQSTDAAWPEENSF